MKIIYSLFLFLSINLFSQEIYDLEYYFGEDYKNFNESIPKIRKDIQIRCKERL